MQLTDNIAFLLKIQKHFLDENFSNTEPNLKSIFFKIRLNYESQYTEIKVNSFYLTTIRQMRENIKTIVRLDRDAS